MLTCTTPRKVDRRVKATVEKLRGRLEKPVSEGGPKLLTASTAPNRDNVKAPDRFPKGQTQGCRAEGKQPQRCRTKCLACLDTFAVIIKSCTMHLNENYISTLLKLLKKNHSNFSNLSWTTFGVSAQQSNLSLWFLGGKYVQPNGGPEGRDRGKLMEIMEEYKKHKIGFAKNIRFRANTTNLCKYRIFLCVVIYLFRWHNRVSSLAADPDLLRHCHLWWNREGCQDDFDRPNWPHRRHHGAPHRLLHPQWGRDYLLCCKTHHVPENF